MNEKTPQHPPSSHGKALRILGVVAMLIGLGIAAAIYRHGQAQARIQEQAEEQNDGGNSIEDSKRLSQEMEMNWGKLGLLGEKLSRMAGEWEQPIPLAIGVATVSILACAGCFFAASQWDAHSESEKENRATDRNDRAS